MLLWRRHDTHKGRADVRASIDCPAVFTCSSRTCKGIFADSHESATLVRVGVLHFCPCNLSAAQLAPNTNLIICRLVRVPATLTRARLLFLHPLCLQPASPLKLVSKKTNLNSFMSVFCNFFMVLEEARTTNHHSADHLPHLRYGHGGN
jgi:hypothetical protein